VPVKINGKRPKKLLNTRNRNNPKNNMVLPFKDLSPSRILISLCRVDLIDSNTNKFELGVSQKTPGITRIGINTKRFVTLCQISSSD
jgi:hypothetical protein